MHGINSVFSHMKIDYFVSSASFWWFVYRKRISVALPNNGVADCFFSVFLRRLRRLKVSLLIFYFMEYNKIDLLPFFLCAGVSVVFEVGRVRFDFEFCCCCFLRGKSTVPPLGNQSHTHAQHGVCFGLISYNDT